MFPLRRESWGIYTPSGIGEWFQVFILSPFWLPWAKQSRLLPKKGLRQGDPAVPGEEARPAGTQEARQQHWGKL